MASEAWTRRGQARAALGEFAEVSIANPNSKIIMLRLETDNGGRLGHGPPFAYCFMIISIIENKNWEQISSFAFMYAWLYLF